MPTSKIVAHKYDFKVCNIFINNLLRITFFFNSEYGSDKYVTRINFETIKSTLDLDYIRK